MAGETFICEVCKRKLPKDPKWDDRDALAELEASYPGLPVEECGVTCDDCYKLVRRMFHG